MSVDSDMVAGLFACFFNAFACFVTFFSHFFHFFFILLFSVVEIMEEEM